MTARPDRGRLASLILAALTLALVVAGLALTWSDRQADPPEVLAGPTAGAAPDEVPPRPVGAPLPDVRPPSIPPGARRPGSARSGPPPTPRPGPPRRLVIPSLGVDAPVVPIVDDARALTPPDDPQVLGWWSRGARPGGRTGTALIAGHTVSTGGGALDDLGDIRKRARLEVRTDRLRMPYVVRKVRVFGKGRLLTEAERLFDQDVQGRLVVITCADWNGTEYLSNVVITAVPWHGPDYRARYPTRKALLAPSVERLPRSMWLR